MRFVVPTGILCFLVTFCAGCVSAQINVVDERTALENQILGSYEELDNNMQLLASVRAVSPDGTTREKPRFSEIRRLAIRARQTHQFNRDDVEELKQAGCLGEANDGTLVSRACPRNSDPAIADRLKRLIESENEARAVILRFVVATSPDLTSKDLDQVTEAYVRMQREKANPGEWIQRHSGEWVRKE